MLRAPCRVRAEAQTFLQKSAASSRKRGHDHSSFGTRADRTNMYQSFGSSLGAGGLRLGGPHGGAVNERCGASELTLDSSQGMDLPERTIMSVDIPPT